MAFRFMSNASLWAPRASTAPKGHALRSEACGAHGRRHAEPAELPVLERTRAARAALADAP